MSMSSLSMGRHCNSQRQPFNRHTVQCCHRPPASHERQLVSMCSLAMGRCCNSQRQLLSMCSLSRDRQCHSTMRKSSPCGQTCAGSSVPLSVVFFFCSLSVTEHVNGKMTGCGIMTDSPCYQDCASIVSLSLATHVYGKMAGCTIHLVARLQWADITTPKGSV